MSCVIADSGTESLSVIATQHEDWIIQQAFVLLEPIQHFSEVFGAPFDVLMDIKGILHSQLPRCGGH